jgi:hypothetical protein
VSDYRKLSIVEKRAQNIATVREAAIPCPSCGTQVMPVDLLAHLQQRCAGPREPGPGSKWVTFREVRSHGVPKQTLTDWVKTGKVRRRGSRVDYEYLWRDLVVLIAERLLERRRESGLPDSALDASTSR